MPADSAQRNLLPVATSALAIGATDTIMGNVFAAGFCRQVVSQGTGTVAIKRVGDSVFTAYAMTAGEVLEGIFVAVGGTGSGSSAITVNLEL
jgi:hypothetical protein